jgi:oxygen-independent coproporphyrinogen-3 oxidase
MASLYLHIPFCEHKCLYCDFYSVAPNGEPAHFDVLVERFLRSLETEIELRGRDERFQVSYETVFFGGGTPSLLSPRTIENILNHLARRFTLEPQAEVTLETNPGTVDREKLRAFRLAGVNRLSIGVQSFHDDELRFLSRIHSAEQAKECVRTAYAAGFDNVSFDLIFALPDQTLERWKSNLERAMELAPQHLSIYSLIVEPHTPLHRLVETKQVVPLSAEADAEMYEFTIDFVCSHGYEQYEVSNFARPGYKSRHNSNYWNHQPYLGFGPSAHSFWQKRRWWNVSNVVEYAVRLERGVLPVAGEEQLTLDQMRTEEIFLGLRSEGIDVAGFQKRYETNLLDVHRQTIDHLLNIRLATLEADRLRLTSKGYPLCDEISSSLLC